RGLRGGRHAAVILHRAHAGIQIQNLTKGNIQRSDTAAHRRGQRAFDGDTELPNGIHTVIGQPVVELGFCFFSSKYLIPCDSPFPFVGPLHRGIKNASRGFPDVAAAATEDHKCSISKPLYGAENESETCFIIPAVYGGLWRFYGLTAFRGRSPFCSAVCYSPAYVVRHLPSGPTTARNSAMTSR